MAILQIYGHSQYKDYKISNRLYEIVKSGRPLIYRIEGKFDAGLNLMNLTITKIRQFFPSQILFLHVTIRMVNMTYMRKKDQLNHH